MSTCETLFRCGGGSSRGEVTADGRDASGTRNRSRRQERDDGAGSERTQGMKANELREMSDEQLEATAQDAAKNLFRFRIKSQTEQLRVPSEQQANRKLIARIKTIQTERRQGRTG